MFTQFRKPMAVVSFSAFFFGFFSLTPMLHAQDADEKEKTAKKKYSKAGQVITLENDRFLTREESPVQLSAVYHYGNADKETTPVLLLHGDNGNHQDFTPLIGILSDNGYAVLAVDLRGQGKSTKRYELIPAKIETQIVPNGKLKTKLVPVPIVQAPPSRRLVEYHVADFKPEDYEGMVKADLPLWRYTLEKVHAEGMINLHRLAIVGVGRGAALAAYQTAVDWKNKNSDRFTKTLVMIAPTELNTRSDLSKGFANNKWMRTNLGILFAVPNEDSAGQGIAERIRNALLEKNEDETLEGNFLLINYPSTKTVQSGDGKTKTEMTMTEILTSSETKLGDIVYNFIDNRNQKLEIRWSKLK
jgi:pimeloyl-ACP methyl ester carboxylesterase